MNNALGVARAVRTRRKCRRDSHAAGESSRLEKKTLVGIPSPATPRRRAPKTTLRVAPSPSTLVPRRSSLRSPLRRRAARANRPRRPKNRHPRSRTRTRNRYRRSRRFGSRARAPARARRRHRTRDVVNRRVRRVVTKVPRRGAPSARRAMEESVTGRCRVCRGQPSADFGVLDARWVPGAFRARLSERDGTKEKRAGTYLRSAFPRELRGGRSARTRRSGRKRSWFTAGLFFVHRHVRHGPLLRQRWGGREQSVQVAFWQRFVAIGGEERHMRNRPRPRPTPHLPRVAATRPWSSRASPRPLPLSARPTPSPCDAPSHRAAPCVPTPRGASSTNRARVTNGLEGLNQGSFCGQSFRFSRDESK